MDQAAATGRPDALFMEILGAGGDVDPYPLYRELRETAPVFKNSLGLWILTRYDDCRAVLRDPRMGKNWAQFAEASGVENWRDHVSLQTGDRSLLFLNPPDHTRLRRLVSRAFSPRQVERLRVSMRKDIQEMLNTLADAGTADLLTTLAFPLPVTVIGRLLGVPQQDWESFRDHVRAATATLELGFTAEQLAAADVGMAWQRDYFIDLIAHKRQHRDEGMISAMIEVEESGDRLTDEEIVMLSALLFAAGFETTTNLIGNGMHALLNNPDQLALLRERPELVEPATEELLRYDASIQLSTRSAFEDIELDGHTIAAGEAAVTLIGAANRDPARFKDPEKLDVTRTNIEPLSFGSGIHFCLGANLARVEAHEAFGGLLSRFANIELAQPARYRGQMVFRGLEALEVRVTNR